MEFKGHMFTHFLSSDGYEDKYDKINSYSFHQFFKPYTILDEAPDKKCILGLHIWANSKH